MIDAGGIGHKSGRELSEADLREFYEREYLEKFPLHPEHADDKLAKLLRVITGMAGGRVRSILDVGCGSGEVLRKLSRAIGADAVGLDLAHSILRFARTLGDMGGELCLLQGSAEGLPFRDAQFDLVVFTDVIEHLLDPLRALREARRVTRWGVTVIVPIHGALDALSRWYWLHRSGQPVPFSEYGHLRDYMYGSFRTQAAAAGLRVAAFDFSPHPYDLPAGASWKRRAFSVVHNAVLRATGRWPTLGRSLVFGEGTFLLVR